MATVSRSIYFYAIYLLKKRGSFKSGETDFFNDFVTKELSGNKMVFKDDPNEKKVLFLNQNTATVNKEVNVSQNVKRFKLEDVRKSDLPQGRNMNNLEDMPISLEEDQGMAEPCHFIVIDGKIVVAEFNQRAPRARFHLEYLLNRYAKKLDENWRIQVRPIISDDMKQVLEGFKDIMAVQIKLAPNHKTVLFRGKNSIIRTLGISRAMEKATIAIRISSKGGFKNKKRTKKFFDRLIYEVGENLDNLKNQKLSGLTVTGRTENDNTDKVDLIKSLLKVKEEVVRLNNERGVDSASMFDKLEQAYEEHKEYLNKYEW